MSCTAHICRHHKRAHTCVTHTPAHACCNNRQKGPMVDKFRLTALRRAQAWGPRPAVVGYMMFPSQGSRTVTCCCPAAVLAPVPAPTTLGHLGALPTCPRPSPAPTLRPHTSPPTRGAPVEVRSVAGGGHWPAALPQPVAASLLGRTRGRPRRPPTPGCRTPTVPPTRGPG